MVFDIEDMERSRDRIFNAIHSGFIYDVRDVPHYYYAVVRRMLIGPETQLFAYTLRELLLLLLLLTR